MKQEQVKNTHQEIKTYDISPENKDHRYDTDPTLSRQVNAASFRRPMLSGTDK